MNKRLERAELQSLVERAKSERDDATNPEWRLAYDNFILAASTLDAFIARSSVISCDGTGRPLEIGTEAGWAKPEVETT